MFEDPLPWLGVVLAVIWLTLHKRPTISGFVNLAAPLGIVVCVISGLGLFKARTAAPAPAPTPALNPPPSISPPSSVAVVRPQGEVNMRSCPGADCDVIAQLRRSSKVSLTGKTMVVETSTGSLQTWAEISTTGGDYCALENLKPGSGCQVWQQQPHRAGWMNQTFLRAE